MRKQMLRNVQNVNTTLNVITRNECRASMSWIFFSHGLTYASHFILFV